MSNGNLPLFHKRYIYYLTQKEAFMADKNNKVKDNVAGAWYVDDQCIACGMCISEAPENFDMNDDDMAYVKKQPEGDEELEACEDAKDECPVEAIGNDG